MNLEEEVLIGHSRFALGLTRVATRVPHMRVADLKLATIQQSAVGITLCEFQFVWLKSKNIFQRNSASVQQRAAGLDKI